MTNYLTLVRMATIKKTRQNKDWQEYGKGKKGITLLPWELYSVSQHQATRALNYIVQMLGM